MNLLLRACGVVDGESTDTLVWRGFCGHCNWQVNNRPSRDDVLTKARAHVDAMHGDDDEWEFRIQGFAR